jgi:hypothetical protein
MTVLGAVKLDRIALIPASPADAKKLAELKQLKMVIPLDEALGIDRLPFKISVDAMLEICHWVQEVHSYEAAGRAIRRNTDIRVNDDTIRAVANHVGSLVFEKDKERAEQAWALYNSAKIVFPKTKNNYDLYIEVDGAMLHVRKKVEDNALEGTEAKSLWMENKLGMVFSSEHFIKWIDKKGEKQQKIGQREYIAYLGEADEFKKHLWAMALRNGYGNFSQTILISDGDTWIRNMKEELFPDAQQILDFYHLRENVTNFGKIIFDNVETKYKPWSDNICKLLKSSQTDLAIKEITHLGKKNISKSQFNLLGYIDNNKNNIDYARYLENGWYIGSGAIESANKAVLQQRLKQAGMRWNRESGQFILSLMSKVKSDVWERDVAELVKSKYEVVGAYDLIGYPLRRIS